MGLILTYPSRSLDPAQNSSANPNLNPLLSSQRANCRATTDNSNISQGALGKEANDTLEGLLIAKIGLKLPKMGFSIHVFECS